MIETKNILSVRYIRMNRNWELQVYCCNARIYDCSSIFRFKEIAEMLDQETVHCSIASDQSAKIESLVETECIYEWVEKNI